MANVVIVGAQWGDEGKAKITDMLASEADIVVRCQGGCNAGHTVKHEGQLFKFHLIPSGLLYANPLCVIGNGTVIDPTVLMREVTEMVGRGFAVTNLKISDRAHITLPFHVALDKAQEAERTGHKIGTTGRGIGPTYMDKVGRTGLRVGDLYDTPEGLRARLTEIAGARNPLLVKGHQLPPVDVEALMNLCADYAEQLKPFVCDTVSLIHEALSGKQKILVEGAQGTLLDVDFGTYPYVTSSNATAGGACTGSGIGPTQLDHVLGVMKAYLTRVGEGPFPTELTDETGRYLMETGQEIGTTTGRPRRCGWFDAVIGRYSVMVNGLNSVAITKLDVLDDLATIQICTGYRSNATGEVTTAFPARLSDLSRMTPVYETLPGWKTTTADVRTWDDLPANARSYLKRLSELIGCPISMVSVGPERVQTILLDNPLHGAPRALGLTPSLTLI
ncbi:MAG: adenylosuccinate synthase [Candidatus Melainabacteria bacterium]